MRRSAASEPLRERRSRAQHVGRRAAGIKASACRAARPAIPFIAVLF